MSKVTVIAPEPNEAVPVKALQGLGYECVLATDPDQAVRTIAADESIVIAVVDYNMPGDALGKLIAKLKSTRPHLTLVGQSHTNQRLNFSALGVWHSLRIPWTADQLMACIQDNPKEVVRSRVAMTVDTKHRWLSSMEGRLHEVASSNRTLSEELAAAIQQQDEVRNQQTVLQSTQRSFLTGVDERLADLENKLDVLMGTVQALADTAVETAQGSANKRLESVVAGRLGALGSISDEMIQFLRENEVFDSLSTPALKLICTMGEIQHIEPGNALFKRGDACSTFYVVYSGVIEVRRPQTDSEMPESVSFLGTGDILCEKGLLSSTSHTATAIAPDGAELLAITHDLLGDIFSMFPLLAVQLFVVISERLESTRSSGTFKSDRRRLQGCLAHFDIASILQGLVSGETRNGTLRILNNGSKEMARLQFADGRIAAARYEHRKGVDAINRLLDQDLSTHTFTYRECTSTDTQRLPTDRDLRSLSVTKLLLDAARRSDEKGRGSASKKGGNEPGPSKAEMSRENPDSSNANEGTPLADGGQGKATKGDQASTAPVYRRAADKLDWSDPKSQKPAERIWELSESGVGLEDLMGALGGSEDTILQVLEEMENRGLVTAEVCCANLDGSSESWIMDSDNDEDGS